MRNDKLRIYNIPYTTRFNEKFLPGQTITIQGKTFQSTTRVLISFRYRINAENCEHPLIMHFLFDKLYKKITLTNYLLTNEIGEFETNETKINPIEIGKNFDIRIRAHVNFFQIYINRQKFLTYNYRRPVEKITHMIVDGDLIINDIYWSGNFYRVPYDSRIVNNGFGFNKKMFICGTPATSCRQFSINLVHRDDNIALNLNPRFGDNIIVLNSLQTGQWGAAEFSLNPIKTGLLFDIMILNDLYHFVIFLNGSVFYTFAHRSYSHDINGIQVHGDVEIIGIHIS